MLALSLAIGVATMPLFKAALDVSLPGPAWWQSVLEANPGSSSIAGGVAATTDVRYDLGRLARRYLVLVGLLVFIGLRRWFPQRALARDGFRRHERWRRHVGAGIVAGVAVVVVYAAMITASDHVGWNLQRLGHTAERLAAFIAGAILVAIAEEYVFRGVFLRSMIADWGKTRAIAISSGIYAAVHSLSGSYVVGPGWDWAIGLRLCRIYFSGGENAPLLYAQLMIGLFLLGIVMAALYLRSGSLWVPVGFHAGMVVASKILKKLWLTEPGFEEWLLGDTKFLVAGVATWVILLIALAVIPRLMPTARQASDS